VAKKVIVCDVWILFVNLFTIFKQETALANIFDVYQQQIINLKFIPICPIIAFLNELQLKKASHILP